MVGVERQDISPKNPSLQPPGMKTADLSLRGVGQLTVLQPLATVRKQKHPAGKKLSHSAERQQIFNLMMMIIILN